MDDLITRLTAAIDETERNGFLGQSPLGYVTADKVYLPTEVQFVYYSWDVTAREAVLRGCVADRKLLDLAAGMLREAAEQDDAAQATDGRALLAAVAERYGLEDTDG